MPWFLLMSCELVDLFDRDDECEACFGPSGTAPIPSTSSSSGGTCPDGFSTDPPFVQSASVGCEAPGNVTFRVEAEGWTYPPNTAYAINTGEDRRWDENHPIPTVAFDVCGTWDHLELTIPTRDAADKPSPDDYFPGASSAFTCEDHYDAALDVMTFAVAVTDEGGNLSDCIAFGHDPAGLVRGAYSGPNGPDFDLTGCTSF